MAQQIKKKFIAPDAVGASQLLIEQGQAVRVVDGSNVLDLVKYDAGSQKMKVLGNNIAAYVSDVDAEKARAEAAEQALGARIDSVISNVDPAAVDSLSEVVQAFEAADSELYDAVVALGNSAGAGLTQEIADRQAADLVLDGKITQEASDRQAADLVLDGKIAQEILDRQAGDLAEQQRAMAAEAVLTQDVAAVAGDLASEISDRGAADQVLDGKIAQEILDRVAGDQLLDGKITQEASDRAAADLILDGKISQEATDRAAADLVLDGKIAQEVIDRDAAILVEKQRAESAEAALGVRIDNLLTNTDETALNSLAEIVTEFQSVDGDLQTAINNLASSATTALAEETQARQAADTLLQGAIDAEALARGSEDALMLKKDGSRDLEGSLKPSVSFDPMDMSGVDLGSAEKVYRGIYGAMISTGMIDAPSALPGVGFNNKRVLYVGAATESTDAVNKGQLDAVESALDARLDVLEADPVTMEAVTFMYQDLMGRIDDVDGYAQDVRSDLDAELLVRAAADSALETRIVALEALTDGPAFSRESFVAASPLTHIDLSMEVISNSLNVFVGRLALHMGEDYSVSVVDGKTRITWMGDFAVGGVEAITEGDKIFVNYAYTA